MFKQLPLTSAVQYCQVDACHLGGVNEVLAVLLTGKEVSHFKLHVFARRQSDVLTVRDSVDAPIVP